MIQDEKGYALKKKEWSELNAAMLAVRARSVYTLSGLLEDECELGDIESKILRLQLEMSEFDERFHGDRKGRWMPLYTGTRFWPEDPRPQDIDIRDIAHSLATLNRFNGHTRTAFSVAQHSVLVSGILPKRFKLFGLLHDAAECYLGDVITPVKRLIAEIYGPLEDAVMSAVAQRFGFLDIYESSLGKAMVRRADLTLLATEVRDLTVAGYVNGVLSELPLKGKIETCWPADVAEDVFLTVFEELSNVKG